MAKGKICFSEDEEIIEKLRIIAIKKKVNASRLVEPYLKKCIEDNKDLL